MSHQALLAYATRHGYTSLDEWKGMKKNKREIKYSFRCDKGHVFIKTYGNAVYRKQKCQICGTFRALDLDVIEAKIRAKGNCQWVNRPVGNQLLTNSIQLHCEEHNHTYATKSYEIMSGKTGRCSHCAGNARLTIDDCHAAAAANNGICLETKYVNNRTRMRWKCGDCDHIWKTSYDSIKTQESWCPNCAGLLKLTIDECKSYAAEKKGECLSTEYVNNNTNMKWKCHSDHQWEATFANVKRERWCPTCAGNANKSETLTREILKSFTGYEWDPIRPKWLMGNKNYPLELDGWCPELNMAFEYQGVQHYKRSEYFHRTQEDFEDQKKRDKLKRAICKKRGITLLEIPYVYNYTDPSGLEDHIFEILGHHQF
jgi:hypothetical protein